MAFPKDILLNNASIIKNANTEGFNTAQRVGKMFIDIINSTDGSVAGIEERLEQIANAISLTDFYVRLMGAPMAVNPKKFKFTLHLMAVWKSKDVTSEILADDITWTRYTEGSDGVQCKASDDAWNALHQSAAHDLTLTEADIDFVNNKPPTVCTFYCTVKYNEPDSGDEQMMRVGQGVGY